MSKSIYADDNELYAPEPGSELEIRILEAKRERDEDASYADYCERRRDAEVKKYPCDDPDGFCPYIDNDDSQATGMYFCYNHCGLGVDEDEEPECDHEWEVIAYSVGEGTETIQCIICGKTETIYSGYSL